MIKTADVVITGLPPHSVAQAFVDEEDDRRMTLHIRRWDRKYIDGWSTPYSLTIRDRNDKNVILANNVAVPPSAKVSVTVPVSCNREIPLTKKFAGKIPMNFFQTTGHKITGRSDYSGVINNLHRINKMLQCNFNYRCLNDDEARDEIRLSGNERLVKAYNDLVSPTYRADLLRYYLLYKYGGIYMDDKSMLRYPLDTNIFAEILNREDCDGFLVVVKSCLNPEIAFMASRPGSRVILEVLNRAIGNVENRFYAESPFEITGNKCFQRVLEKSSTDLGDNWYNCHGEKLFFFERKLHHETLSLNNDIHWIQFVVPWIETTKWRDPKYYVNLNFRRQVYVDGNDKWPEVYGARKFFFSSWQFVVVTTSIVVSLLILYTLQPMFGNRMMKISTLSF